MFGCCLVVGSNVLLWPVDPEPKAFAPNVVAAVVTHPRPVDIGRVELCGLDVKIHGDIDAQPASTTSSSQRRLLHSSTLPTLLGCVPTAAKPSVVGAWGFHGPGQNLARP